LRGFLPGGDLAFLPQGEIAGSDVRV
jgi:hypothetical protein